MALIYGLVRAIAVAFTQLATWRHRRAMRQLEKADAAFRATETSCKAEEVAVGRPLDYPAQIRLLREYENREAAHSRWKKAAGRLKKRKRVQFWLAKWNLLPKRMIHSIPKPVRSILVVLCGVPFGRWFLESYVCSNFFEQGHMVMMSVLPLQQGS